LAASSFSLAYRASAIHNNDRLCFRDARTFEEPMPPRRRHAIAAALLFTAALPIVLSVALAGCGSLNPPPPTPIVEAQIIEPMLSAAGFTMLPADTPEREQKLSSLVPLQVQYYVGKTGKLHYWMADPYYCKCMYLGDEQAYQQYEKMKLNEQLVEKEGEISRQTLEERQMEEMDMQEEMFSPYGMSLAGPMGPAMYW
jgi:hypothetical protein